MGRLGGPELLVILFIVLLLFGSKKLPELARSLGQSIKEFNKAKEEGFSSTAITDTKKPDTNKPENKDGKA